MNTSVQKSILITGCSSGIGRCAADTLKQRGYRVLASARKAEDVQALLAQGHEALQLDTDDSASIRRAFDETMERTGGQLYALFNNAGYGQAGAVEDLSREALRAQFESNVFGTQELTNLVLPVMRRQGYGRIIQNSSVLGVICLPYRGAYNASKYALEALYDTMRLELTGTGIHMVLIQPGPIESRFRANAHAVFKRTIDPNNSAHQRNYEGMIRRFEKVGPAAPFTLPASAVVDKLILALEKPRPRARYRVTVPTYLFSALKRTLSTRAMDSVLRLISRNELK